MERDLEQVLTRAADSVETALDHDEQMARHVAVLLEQGQNPWVVRLSNHVRDAEILVTIRKYS